MSKIHFWDEMVYLQNAQVICCGKVNYSEFDFRPPLLSMIFAGVFFLWRHIFAACIATAFVNALGPVFLFFAGRLSVGRLPAAIASLLLAFSPFFIGIFPDGFPSDDTGNSLLTDSPALTLVLLGFWLLLRAIERPTVFRFFCAGFALALCILMRFGSIPSVAMLLLLLLVTRSRWQAIVACLSGLAVGLAPYLIWSRFKFGGFLFTLRAGWTHVEGPVEPFMFFIRNAATIFTPVVLIGLLLSLVSQRPFLRAPFHSVPGAPMRSDSTSSQRLVKAYLWLWLLLGLLFFSLMPHKEPRYILPLAPPVLLLASSGLALFSALPSKPLRVTAAFILGAILLVTFLPLRERFSTPVINSTSTDEELASGFLESSVPAGTSLYMSFNYPAFAFYTNFRIHELSSIGPALYRDMEQIPSGEVLIVYREAEESSQSDIAWVDAHRKFRRMRDFPSFVIFRSVAPPESATP
jgi:4-amino-4-deoxy-L-arabinose transferase-like glycosyltransferase